MPRSLLQRRHGISGLIDRCQLLAGRTIEASPSELILGLQQLTPAIPHGLTVPEQRLVRSVLGQAFSRVVVAARLDGHPGIARVFLLWEASGPDDSTWRSGWARLVDGCAAAINEAAANDGINERKRDERNGLEHAANPCVDRVLRLIDTRYRDPELCLIVVAKEARLSPWHVARTLTRQTGLGFVAHLRRARVSAARRLLAQNLLSVKEIAASVGYTHPNRLGRDFMRVCGMAPSTFRSRFLTMARVDLPANPTARNDARSQ